MKKKSNSKKLKLEINSFDDTLFKELTHQELKQIKGGSSGLPNSDIITKVDFLDALAVGADDFNLM